MQYLFLFILFIFITQAHAAVREIGDVADFTFADLYIDKLNFPQGAELITPDYAHYFLSQSHLNTLLRSELTIDLANRRLSGQLWGEEINLALSPDQVVTLDGEPHVRLDVLGALDIEQEFNARTQVLVFDTAKRHPKSQEKQRQQRKNILAAMAEKRANRVMLQDQYQWLNAPYVDVQLSSSYSKQNSTANAYLAMNQDAFYHQANIVLTDSNQNSLNGRVQLAKNLDDRRQYQIGDLQRVSGVLLNNSGSGLGLRYGAKHRSAGAPLVIEGYAEPGSEVELYRNNVLFDLIQVEGNGQYQFPPIRTLNANHSYHLMIQSPSGKRQRRAVVTQAGSGYKPGQWYSNLTTYTTKASILKKRRFNPEEEYINPQFNYVLSHRDEMAVGAEWLNNKQRRSALYYFTWERASSPGMANWSLKAGCNEHLYYDLKWLFPLSQSHVVSLSAERGHGHFGKEKINSLNYEYNLEGWQFSSNLGLSQLNESSYKSLDSYLSYRTELGSLAASLGHIEGGEQSEQQYTLLGNIYGSWGRARLNWRKTQGPFKQHTLSVSYTNHFNGYYGTLQFRRSFSKKHNVSSFTLSKSFDAVSVNSSASYHEAMGWQVGLSLSFSFYGPTPLHSISNRSSRLSSTLKLRAFYDRNNNHRYDPDDDYLPDVSVMMHGSQVAVLEQEDAKTLLHMPSNRPITLEVAHDDMDALYLQPQFGLIEADLHPGASQTLDIPFHLQFEAEGIITLLDSLGDPAEFSARIALELIRENSGEKTVIYSEPDGFFFFDKLKQGKYVLQVSPEYLKQKQLSCSPCRIEFGLDEHSEQLFLLEEIILYPNSASHVNDDDNAFQAQ